MSNVWKQFYALVWLAFLQIIIITVPSFTVFLVDAHVLLGLGILALAHMNSGRIRKTEAPERLKRIAKSTAILATFQVILGIILYADLRLAVTVPLVDVISFIHFVIALAIITQASSVATAYDMWEEHEFSSTVKPA
jgi:hypothetical protein